MLELKTLAGATDNYRPVIPVGHKLDQITNLHCVQSSPASTECCMANHLNATLLSHRCRTAHYRAVQYDSTLTVPRPTVVKIQGVCLALVGSPSRPRSGVSARTRVKLCIAHHPIRKSECRYSRAGSFHHRGLQMVTIRIILEPMHTHPFCITSHRRSAALHPSRSLWRSTRSSQRAGCEASRALRLSFCRHGLWGLDLGGDPVS